MTEPETSVLAHYDESWKAAIEQYFEAFVAFFFPQAHQAIAWEQGYEFLDQELQLLDRMMRLPEPLELIFRDKLKQFEEENQMPYMSSFERIGRQEGIQQGQQEKAKKLIQSLLKNRFNVIDEELSLIIEPLAQMPDDEVADLLLTCSREEILARFGSYGYLWCMSKGEEKAYPAE